MSTMALQSSTSVFHRNILCFSALNLLVTLGVMIFLLSGCASEQVLPTSPESAGRSPVNQKKAAYNKPYKVKGKTYYPMESAAGYRERGVASWYGSESGSRTAMGRRFKPNEITAAHKTLPLPCKVRVTNLRNGKTIDVLVNDRGPFKNQRLIDLSRGAAMELGIKGLSEVEVEYLGGEIGNF